MPLFLYFYSFVSFSLFLCCLLFLSDPAPHQLKLRLWWIEPAATAQLSSPGDLRVSSQCAAASTTHRINTSVMHRTESRLVCHMHRTPTEHASTNISICCHPLRRHPSKVRRLKSASLSYKLTHIHTHRCLLYVTSCKPPLLPNTPPTYTQRLIRQENQKSALPRLKEHCGCYCTRAP